MTIRSFLRNDGQFAQVDAGSISISTTTTTAFLTFVTKATTADIAMNSAGSFFDGPAVSQGSSGTWMAGGTVFVKDTTGAANMLIKLWDGTTTMAIVSLTTPAASFQSPVGVFGAISSPAGNLRISVEETTAATGVIGTNSNITAIRIG